MLLQDLQMAAGWWGQIDRPSDNLSSTDDVGDLYQHVTAILKPILL